ncbi:glycoside hydrolase N-terminal domain-containing protein [Planomonospora sp. ID67723]|uniref:glycosyl hydrolase family 95 catalytic domain-containing protein n=1 Tax=Planomonospora sp. ID67723 TaxID=2738134 RepID=UPI0018C35E23|nr:glycoside hydrolase N-terminal domain-containing protein [Planomonospora sp. ID67723]MBG0827949.1 glycoside hydrolase N-terminal domain-containing protein [Planomonospora sp. ID67723]
MDHGFVSRDAAGDWERALITGNGRQGALVYGGPEASGGSGDLRVTLSHERLFLPVAEPLAPPHTAPVLPELRALLYGGRPREAAGRVVELAAGEHAGYADTRWIDPLVPSATLAFSPATPDAVPGDYRRSCDFATGLVTQQWGRARQEVFVSRPADAVVIRFSGAGGLLSLAPIGEEPPVPVRFTVDAGPGRLTLEAGFSARWPGAAGGYTVECRVSGAAEPSAGGLVIEGEATVLARTVVHGSRPRPIEEIPGGFDLLLREHAAVHGDLFARSSVRLGRRAENPASGVSRPEGEAGARVERLFRAGRYAVISSSGELPPTLQGVWSGTYDPPWRSGFTMDGNLASAVAGLAATGTPELMLPVFDLAEGLMEDFRQNARRLYGCRGILVPAHLSTHGLHNHFGPVWCLTFWTAGAGWLARLYHDHYAHTGDLAFLRERAWPFMTEAALFYEDFLTASGDFAPSYSPENTPSGGDSQACVNATMDVAVARDLLRNLVHAGERLGLGHARWQRLLDRLPGYRIAPGGELAEWIGARDSAADGARGPAAGSPVADNHAHRHASHLYPLWYERDPAFDDPRLAAAAVLAVRRRLAWWRGSDSDEMAFGLVQLGLAAAALGLAEEAHEALTLLATRYWREENLVSTHNRDAIFNVDVCGGLPALVAAMLVRSSLPPSGYGRVDLLPARPRAWPSGEARGLTVRGGTVERLTWEPGRVEAVVTAWAPLLVVCGSQRARVLPGETLPLTFVGLDAKLIQELEA